MEAIEAKMWELKSQLESSKIGKSDNSKQPSNSRESKTKKSTSKCPKCGGCGFVEIIDEEGIDRLIRCECVKVDIKKAKFKFAEMPDELKDLKMNTFDTGIYAKATDVAAAKQAKKICINFVREYQQIKEKHTGLYLYSYTKGSGKTRLAVALGNGLMDIHGARVKFATTVRLLQEIKATFGVETQISTERYLDAIKTVEVLILDDIGAERPKDWVNETFYEIINQRMLSKLITIYTSNCTINELQHDDRIKSRIQGTTFPVKCPEEDIRCKLQHGQNLELEKLLLE